MRRLVLYVSLVTLASFLVVARSDPAWAARTCNTHGYFFDGFGKRASETYTTYGVSAQVRVQTAIVCEGDPSADNLSTAWTMVSSHQRGGWAQTGFIRWYHHDTVHYSQYRRGPSYPLMTRFGNTSLSPGETHQYWTLRTSSTGCPSTTQCLIGHIDQTTWFYTPFDPVGEWSTPFLQFYSGETHYLEANIPGVDSAKTGFNYMQYVNGNNQWVTQPCAMDVYNDHPYRWTNETVDCNWRRIWTYRP